VTASYLHQRISSTRESFDTFGCLHIGFAATLVAFFHALPGAPPPLPIATTVLFLAHFRSLCCQTATEGNHMMGKISVRSTSVPKISAEISKDEISSMSPFILKSFSDTYILLYSSIRKDYCKVAEENVYLRSS
jgi:hypothetical protein